MIPEFTLVDMWKCQCDHSVGYGTTYQEAYLIWKSKFVKYCVQETPGRKITRSDIVKFPKSKLTKIKMWHCKDSLFGFEGYSIDKNSAFLMWQHKFNNGVEYEITTNGMKIKLKSRY